MKEKRSRRHLHAVETNVTEKIKIIYLFLFLSYAHRDFSKSSESFHDIMYHDKKQCFLYPVMLLTYCQLTVSFGTT